MKKKTIHMSDEFEHKLNQLMDLLGIRYTYGEVPKALNFSVTYALEGLMRDEKVIPVLDKAEFDLWLASVKKIQAEKEKQKLIEELRNEPKK